jgi:transposase
MDASEMPQREMNEGVDGDDAPVGRVGGRSPSRLSTGGGAPAPAAGPLGPGQRWSVARKRAVALRLIAGEPVELVSREIGVPVYKLERWREKAEAALDEALKEREAGTEGAELAAALQRIGELSMEVELLRAKMGQPSGPLARKRWR